MIDSHLGRQRLLFISFSCSYKKKILFLHNLINLIYLYLYKRKPGKEVCPEFKSQFPRLAFYILLDNDIKLIGKIKNFKILRVKIGEGEVKFSLNKNMHMSKMAKISMY